MMASGPAADRPAKSRITITPRMIASIVIAILVVVFVFLNREEAQVSPARPSVATVLPDPSSSTVEVQKTRKSTSSGTSA
jgi:hypothetical protein